MCDLCYMMSCMQLLIGRPHETIPTMRLPKICNMKCFFFHSEKVSPHDQLKCLTLGEWGEGSAGGGGGGSTDVTRGLKHICLFWNKKYMLYYLDVSFNS